MQAAAHVVLFVVGGHGTTPRNLSATQDISEIPGIIGRAQVDALLGTAHVLEEIASLNCG